jgi:hypothetical protein
MMKSAAAGPASQTGGAQQLGAFARVGAASAPILFLLDFNPPVAGNRLDEAECVARMSLAEGHSTSLARADESRVLISGSAS